MRCVGCALSNFFLTFHSNDLPMYYSLSICNSQANKVWCVGRFSLDIHHRCIVTLHRLSHLYFFIYKAIGLLGQYSSRSYLLYPATQLQLSTTFSVLKIVSYYLAKKAFQLSHWPKKQLQDLISEKNVNFDPSSIIVRKT